MGNLVFQATLGGQVNLAGPNTASTFTISVPATTGNMVTTGDTGTVTVAMLSATGTPSSTTYLRGDGTWSSIAAQTYPGAGIANSTGSAWGTSYSTTGSGTVVALATSPSFTTPVLGTPTSGNLSNCTADGTNGVGFLNIPQNSQSAAYTTVLADSGKTIFHPSTDANARTFTIAANSSVSYSLGTVIQFINMSSSNVTISINTDTLTWAQGGGTGSRTLAQYGVANCIKVNTTQWLITGTNLT